MTLSAPFPYFGGKRTVAAEVWSRLGDVTNYVEPFFGSGAVLLARPHAPKVETVSDADHFLCNVWRAIQAAPDDVARFADWPVNEADLASRHAWLVTEGRARIERCGGDPDHYDAKVAGWWIWGCCSWVAGGWCSGRGPWTWDGDKWQGATGSGGISRRLPHLWYGRGINRQLQHLGDGRRGEVIRQWMRDLSVRLRDVRIACGDWSRVCGDSVTWRRGVTGVFLDPPYGVDDRSTVYTHDSRHASAEAREWAVEAGRRSDMRIAFAGYAGEHEFPTDWSTFKWKAHGGYGLLGGDGGQGRANAGRETLWFSPACISPSQADLFALKADLDAAYDRHTLDMFAEDVA